MNDQTNNNNNQPQALRLTGRSIFWTIIAAVFTVLTYNMLMSLDGEARAILLTLTVVLVLIVPGFVMLAFAAGKGSRRDDARDDDKPTEHERDLAAYFIVDQAMCQLQMASRAAYEQGRDDARADLVRRLATDAAIAQLTAEEQGTSITRW